MSGSVSSVGRRGLLLLLVLGLLMGCETAFTSVHTRLVGRWHATDRPWTLEFTGDGGIRMSTIGPAKNGRYELAADGRLRVELQDGRRFQTTVHINGDQMTFTEANGTFIVFKRVS